ncbi:Hypothetical predicted protein [Pelobates cultripes]|uniref:Uncharacterized protein n=1 Tax=Pelobates cultripes TaxID=61616 RepID=A0AAD1RAM1_PELCU|nr:Hypothetical predicted protein [Pelobates cultripes]
MSHRSAKRPAKADKTLFFMAKAAHGKQGREETQDGGGHGSREVSPSPPSSPTSLLEDSPLTLATMKSFMADFTMQIQSTIEGQLKSLAVEEGLKKLEDWGLPKPDVPVQPAKKIPRLSVDWSRA